MSSSELLACDTLGWSVQKKGVFVVITETSCRDVVSANRFWKEDYRIRKKKAQNCNCTLPLTYCIILKR